MFRELLGQLVAPEVLLCDHALDDPRVLEDRQVPIRRAHRQPTAPIEDLVDGQWMDGQPKDLEQRAAARREALADLPEPERDDPIHVERVATRISEDPSQVIFGARDAELKTETGR